MIISEPEVALRWSMLIPSCLEVESGTPHCGCRNYMDHLSPN